MACLHRIYGPAVSNTVEVRYLGPHEIRALAEELDVSPTKKLGQNFVHDPNTVRRIVSAAELEPTDHAVEVGPGLGSLTLALLDHCHRVTAVEIDPRLAARLPQTMGEFAPGRALRLANVDAMRVAANDLEAAPVFGASAEDAESIFADPPTALVANLPYNVSVPVLLHMLAEFPTIRRVLVMVQAEVADRLAATPGSKVYGVPSVKAAWFAEVRRAGAIGRNIFWPAPNVDSGLVAWTKREVPPSTKVRREQVFAVVDTAFAQRRKTLRSTLKNLVGSGDVAETALRAAGVDPQARGEVLTVEEFTAITEALVAAGALGDIVPRAGGVDG